jgi:hypothetical protein
LNLIFRWCLRCLTSHYGVCFTMRLKPNSGGFRFLQSCAALQKK